MNDAYDPLLKCVGMSSTQPQISGYSTIQLIESTIRHRIETFIQREDALELIEAKRSREFLTCIGIDPTHSLSQPLLEMLYRGYTHGNSPLSLVYKWLYMCNDEICNT
jgi:hypothetical protein